MNTGSQDRMSAAREAHAFAKPMIQMRISQTKLRGDLFLRG